MVELHHHLSTLYKIDQEKGTKIILLDAIEEDAQNIANKNLFSMGFMMWKLMRTTQEWETNKWTKYNTIIISFQSKEKE